VRLSTWKVAIRPRKSRNPQKESNPKPEKQPKTQKAKPKSRNLRPRQSLSLKIQQNQPKNFGLVFFS
jgi:hypothetical protein